MKRKIQLVAIALASNICSTYAQVDKIQQGLNDATSDVKKLFGNATDLLYVVCAILALVGAFNVYNKWTSGDQDTTKSAAGWIGGIIFVFVAITILKKVFGV